MIQFAGGIGESSLQIFGLKVRQLGKDLIGAEAGRVKVEHIAHPDPHASDAGLAAALCRVVSDAWIAHGSNLAGLIILKPLLDYP